MLFECPRWYVCDIVYFWLLEKEGYEHYVRDHGFGGTCLVLGYHPFELNSI